MSQTYQNKFLGQLRGRHVIGFCVAVAGESGPNLIIPCATTYFVYFRDNAPRAWCINEGVSTRDEENALLELGLFCGYQVAQVKKAGRVMLLCEGKVERGCCQSLNACGGGDEEPYHGEYCSLLS